MIFYDKKSLKKKLVSGVKKNAVQKLPVGDTQQQKKTADFTESAHQIISSEL